MLWHGKNFRGFLNKAKEVIFDNTGTTLQSTNAEDAIKEVNSNLPHVLWTNPNPTATFAPQTIAINLTNYDAVDITFNRREGGNVQFTNRILKTGYTSVSMGAWDTTTYSLRVISSVTSAGVEFGQGKSYTGSDDNSVMIPMQIVGIKFI